MHEQDTTHDGGGARDRRPPSLGLGRIIIALFWLFGAWIFVTAIVDLFHGQGKPWVTIGLSIAVPIVLWVASLGLEELNSARSAWTGMGVDFYYLPLLVSLIGVVWMWRSNPRRIVSLAEQVERQSPLWKSN